MNTFGRQFAIVATRTSQECRRRTWRTSIICTGRTRSMHVVHTRRELYYPIENGVGDFLPPDALKTVVKWQDGLLERLNEQIKGTSLAKPPILQIIIDSAGEQEHVQAFNYACLAANNSFFLDNLKPPGLESNEAELVPDLRGTINREFGDLEAMKERFAASASGMISSGWLWLVMDNQRRLAVVPTFGAGTLLVRSRKFWTELQQNTLARQPHSWFANPSEHSPSPPGVFPPSQDGPAPTSPVSGIKSTPPPLNPHTPARSIHSSAIVNIRYNNPSVRDHDTTSASDVDLAKKSMQAVGIKLYPLFCISIHEHAWMSAGLGVWGKEEYVRRFFTVVNWKRVSDTFTKFQVVGNQGSIPIN